MVFFFWGRQPSFAATNQQHMPEIDSETGTFITESEGAELTARYRSEYPNTTNAIFFGSDKLQDLLNVSGAIGIRIYYGINEDEKPELVLVAVDEDGNDDLNLILDRGKQCPSTCSTPNALNGL